MQGTLQDLNQAIDEGFRVTDVSSDPAGVYVELHRNELVLTLHLDREEARRILRGGADAPWLHAG